MPARLHFSNSLEALAGRMSEQIRFQHPLSAPILSIPSPSLKRYVQMRLADRLGIAAHFRFQKLERTLWDLLAHLDQERIFPGRSPARMVDDAGMRVLLLQALENQPPQEVRAYLNHDSGFSRDPLPVQLACQLATLFREYEYGRVKELGREGLAHLWSQSQPCFGPTLGKLASDFLRQKVATLEGWQMALYASLFGPQGLRNQLGEKTGEYRFTLPQYAEMVLSQNRASTQPTTRLPTYHFFGLSQISPFHRSLIHELSNSDALGAWAAEFDLYAFNPCAEYWEDSQSLQEKNHKFLQWKTLAQKERESRTMDSIRLQGETLDWPEEENPLLAQWGRPGRETVQLWMQITDYDCNEYFREPTAKHLLATIQSCVLHRQRKAPESPVQPDASLRIAAAPDPFREVEAIFHDLVAAMENDPTLRPEDIAFVPTHPDRYIPILQTVFGRLSPRNRSFIPLDLPTTGAPFESNYLHGLLGLMDLALSRQSFFDVMHFLENPCVMKKFSLEEESLPSLKKILAELKVLDGLDSEHKQKQGLGSCDLRTWSKALDRLVIGMAMDPNAIAEGIAWNKVFPSPNTLSLEPEILATLITALETMDRVFRSILTETSQHLSQWAEIFQDACESLLLPDPENEADIHARLTLRRALEEWIRLQNPEGTGVPATHALGLLKAVVAEIQGNQATFSGGVTVVPLSALRGLPFRRLYILGLGERDFPTSSPPSSLDLRQYRRVPGDPDPLARNRFLFLEALLATQDAVYLTYVNRIPEKSTPQGKSSVLEELILWLESDLLTSLEDTRVTFPILEIPADPYHPSWFQKDSPLRPNPLSEDRMVAYLLRHGNVPAQNPFLHAPSKKEAWGGSLVLPKVRPDSLPTEIIKLSDCVQFLKNPFHYSARRLYGKPWSGASEEQELESTWNLSSRIRKDLLWKSLLALLRNESPLPILEAHLKGATLKGKTPEGAYATLTLRSLQTDLENLEGLVKNFRLQLGEGEFSVWEGLRLGSADTLRGGKTTCRLPAIPLSLTGEPDVQLHGFLPLLLVPEDPQAACVAPFSLWGEASAFLSPFAFYLAALQAKPGSIPFAGLATGRPLHFLKVNWEKPDKNGFKTKGMEIPMSPAQAKELLQVWVKEMRKLDFDDLDLDQAQAALKEIKKNGTPPSGHPLFQSLEQQNQNPGLAGNSNPNRPHASSEWRILQPTIPSDAWSKLSHRLGPFLDACL